MIVGSFDMKICLLRHGETDWNSLGRLQGREDIPLNITGIEQINEVAKYLKNFNWSIIITSPLSRAKKSAEIISKKIGNVTIHEEIDFIERDYGKASGMTSDERKLAFPDGIWIGAESFEKLQNRTINALMKYIKEYDGNNILIVSHGAAINSILAYFSENEIGTEKTTLKNACITLLQKVEDGIKIIYYNKIANELANDFEIV
jgi:uncharacterized phosphatase